MEKPQTDYESIIMKNQSWEVEVRPSEKPNKQVYCRNRYAFGIFWEDFQRSTIHLQNAFRSPVGLQYGRLNFFQKKIVRSKKKRSHVGVLLQLRGVLSLLKEFLIQLKINLCLYGHRDVCLLNILLDSLFLRKK